jgi:hypothetical protein
MAEVVTAAVVMVVVGTVVAVTTPEAGTGVVITPVAVFTEAVTGVAMVDITLITGADLSV